MWMKMEMQMAAGLTLVHKHNCSIVRAMSHSTTDALVHHRHTFVVQILGSLFAVVHRS